MTLLARNERWRLHLERGREIESEYEQKQQLVDSIQADWSAQHHKWEEVAAQCQMQGKNAPPEPVLELGSLGGIGHEHIHAKQQHREAERRLLVEIRSEIEQAAREMWPRLLVEGRSTAVASLPEFQDLVRGFLTDLARVRPPGVSRLIRSVEDLVRILLAEEDVTHLVRPPDERHVVQRVIDDPQPPTPKRPSPFGTPPRMDPPPRGPAYI